ncbi:MULTISPECIES: SP0191 family lipoprotein [unclassified Streptococcus]|uniref:SP0191 family lipoprotein n=1 Tax=unclassified Streptococcus TaxID=2608887 RepID=UPI0018AA944D|nr:MULTISPECIES: SP0191 family lipoprotein [unclassified Streptococcus]MBF8969576.1 hypothetical protein [Streptococcus sp. NLN76]MBJ6745105.1 hypothetical protein [Streptococcus sp. 121]
MKKILITATLSLLVLAGCGQARKENKEAQKEIEITSTLPILTEKVDENAVQKKRLEFPTAADGTTTVQTLTYQGDNYLTFEIELISPLTDELKQSVDEVGVAETNNRLRAGLEEDENYKAATAVRGFTNNVEVLEDQRLKNVSTYNFQDLDLDAIRSIAYFQGSGIVEMSEVTPSKFLEVRQTNGAVVTDAP